MSQRNDVRWVVKQMCKSVASLGAPRLVPFMKTARRTLRRSLHRLSQLAGAGPYQLPPAAAKLFDKDFYSRQYPDLVDAGVDPVAHYFKHGMREGRNPHPLFDTCHYVEQAPESLAPDCNPLIHYFEKGALACLNPHPLFDTAYYVSQAPESLAPGRNPLIHYIEIGAAAGLEPHPLLSATFAAQFRNLQSSLHGRSARSTAGFLHLNENESKVVLRGLRYIREMQISR